MQIIRRVFATAEKLGYIVGLIVDVFDGDDLWLV